MPEIALSRRRAGPVGARRALRGGVLVGVVGLATVAVIVVAHDVVPSDDAGPVFRVELPARGVTTTGDVGHRRPRGHDAHPEKDRAAASPSTAPAATEATLVGTAFATPDLVADPPADAAPGRHDFGPTTSGSGGVTRVVRLAVDDLASVLPALGGVGPGADAVAACVDELLSGTGGTPPRSPCR